MKFLFRKKRIRWKYFLFDLKADANDDFNDPLIEERERCDGLVKDNENLSRLLEEIRSQKLEIENQFKNQENLSNERFHRIEHLENEIQKKEKQILEKVRWIRLKTICFS